MKYGNGDKIYIRDENIYMIIKYFEILNYL
jgi:hypothetical protein